MSYFGSYYRGLGYGYRGFGDLGYGCGCGYGGYGYGSGYRGYGYGSGYGSYGYGYRHPFSHGRYGFSSFY